MKRLIALVLIVGILFSFSLPYSAETVTDGDKPLIYGDVDTNGEVNDKDCVMILRYEANWKVTINMKTSDIDANGEVDDRDCIMLLRYVGNWKLKTLIGTEIPDDKLMLNGSVITDYKVVCPSGSTEIEKNAAQYICDFIKEATGTEIPITFDESPDEGGKEILVGSTDRDFTNALDKSKIGKFQFSITSDENKVQLYGRDFLVAGAAYYFVNSLAADSKNIVIPTEGIYESPKPEKAKNFILFIGDGMGVNHVKLLSDYVPDGADEINSYFAVDELPNQTLSYTDCPEGITDSGAAGTALATGWKCHYQQVGYSSRLERKVENLSELALRMGMTPAILTTDVLTGATPAAFSAHVLDRHYYDEIAEQQANSGIDYLIGELNNDTVVPTLRNTLTEISSNENGFFMMYEEAHIDKYSHDQIHDLDKVYDSMVRANKALNVIMEYTMYHPDTVVIATADHETGKISFKDGSPYFGNPGYHTGDKVPVYAYGVGTEKFSQGSRIDNIDIGKFIGVSMGEEFFGTSAALQ